MRERRTAQQMTRREMKGKVLVPVAGPASCRSVCAQLAAGVLFFLGHARAACTPAAAPIAWSSLPGGKEHEAVLSDILSDTIVPNLPVRSFVLAHA